MDLSNLKWIKNVKHKGNDKLWAYDKTNDMEIPEARIFRLNWRDLKDKDNAGKPQTGELMLLLQKAKVTHVVKFVDDQVYGNDSDEWGIHRIVKALWIPPESLNWEQLPHQEKFFGFSYVVADGAAHDLASENKMQQFHQYWDEKGGLEAFQHHVKKILLEISSTAD